MNDRPSEPIARETRILDGLEVSLRGFDANLQRAKPILERLQHDHAELTADLFGELESFDGQAAIKALVALKAAVERRQP